MLRDLLPSSPFSLSLLRLASPFTLQPISGDVAQCIGNAGYDKAVVRAWRSGGEPDTNAPASLLAFQDAGVETDVYFFPCVGGMDITAQLKGMVNNLGSTMWNRTWFDIEENPKPSCDWSSTNFTANCEWLTELVTIAQSTPPFNEHPVGVYSSIRIWNLFFGGADQCTGIGARGDVPIWCTFFF